MNPQRDALSEALREMAAASPEASPELGARLSGAFARHHVQRRRRRAVVVLGLAACLAMSVYWLRPHREASTARVVAPTPQTAQSPSPAPRTAQGPLPEPKTAATEGPKIPVPSVARTGETQPVHLTTAAKPRRRDVQRSPAAVETADFIALPTFDPAVPVGESHMVRMDLPGSALQLIGYPVDGQLLDRRILTDVLVGQDGMPYAVRLVPTRNVH